MKHLSLRVPWHDRGWDGHFCDAPCSNSSCLCLKRIQSDRDDARENTMAGRCLENLPSAEYPACLAERGMFMAPFDLMRHIAHPYAVLKRGSHAHILPTPLPHPRYSAAAVPFRWMLIQNKKELEKEYGVPYAQEPKIPDFKSSWIQSRDSQKMLGDCFCRQLSPEHSLVFFYAKQVPFVEEYKGRRVIIGVGRIKKIEDGIEYRYKKDTPENALRSMLWERVVHHSIRPDFEDGFLLPYHNALKKVEKDPSFDPVHIVAFSPEDRRNEFSFGAELVSSDTAIAALYEVASSLRKSKHCGIEGPWDRCLEWIDDRLAELWKDRGPFPGLGAVLSVMGLDQSSFVARWILQATPENTDPWELADEILNSCFPENFPDEYRQLFHDSIALSWRYLPEKKRSLLKLMSRFDLTKEQAERLCSDELDETALTDPYRVYEKLRLSELSVTVQTVERSVWVDRIVLNAFPFPEESRITDSADIRRVRALLISELEKEADAGNTLLFVDDCVQRIRAMELEPPCNVTKELLLAYAPDMEDELCLKTNGSSPAFQLKRLHSAGTVIRSAVERRVEQGHPHTLDVDWRSLLDEKLGEIRNDQDESARQEKTAALKIMAEGRFSVLVGLAGTGKTTLLALLCELPEIFDHGVLLLAPTGKARVRMSGMARNVEAKTVAQFLCPQRFDPDTGRYRLSGSASRSGKRTVIIDEASMLTEEMLAAVLEATVDAQRIILVGDPHQLPPIGPGKPFVDIISYLNANPARAARAKAELVIRMRQTDSDGNDLRLSSWFSGKNRFRMDDGLFDDILRSSESSRLRFERWDSDEDLRKLLSRVIMEELQLASEDDAVGFCRSLGGVQSDRFIQFPSAQNAEDWQILSPRRGGEIGSLALNRELHERFRHQETELFNHPKNPFLRPQGPERIIYGDKVINVLNSSGRKTDPRTNPSTISFVANGEIGIVTSSRKKQKELKIQFTSQDPCFVYTEDDFYMEYDTVLELAYALTVHKAQGSEFGLVIFVLPFSSRMLSREMLYTALTRQTKRLVILHQGAASDLRKYASDEYSENARRLTNLFDLPSPVVIDGRYYNEKHIHRTKRGEWVISKSEVILANMLDEHGVDYVYEKPLNLGNRTVWPDFTIDIAATGDLFYWEHCGMLEDPEYRRKWALKLQAYRDAGILPYNEGIGAAGVLIVTEDDPRGGIDCIKIEELIKTVIMS